MLEGNLSGWAMLPFGLGLACVAVGVWLVLARSRDDWRDGVLAGFGESLGNKGGWLAIGIVTLGGLVLRLRMITLDPFLHSWDERYHALVAKHLMEAPLKPMLYLRPELPYALTDWCCNHVWLHKQPLFLWLMAGSMAGFGESLWAMRLPSALLSAATVVMTHEIAWAWTRQRKVAIVAAALVAMDYFSLELVSGRFQLDHNDVVFAALVTASVWALTRLLVGMRIKEERFRQNEVGFPLRKVEAGCQNLPAVRRQDWIWAGLIGLFAGLAVLTKWLPGLLVYASWGVWLLWSSQNRTNLRAWLLLALALVVTTAVALPWQVYTAQTFPAEYAVEQALNRRHVTEAVEGHAGAWWWHLIRMHRLYGTAMLVFLPFGLWGLWRSTTKRRDVTIVLATLVVTSYGFFSLVAATKMTAYVYPVFPVVWILIALGVVWSWEALERRLEGRRLLRRIVQGGLVVFVVMFTLAPTRIVSERSARNQERAGKIHNARLYQALDLGAPDTNVIVLNVKGGEEVELMFYRDVTAYSWWPAPAAVEELLATGRRVVALVGVPGQELPGWMKEDERVIKVWGDFR